MKRIILYSFLLIFSLSAFTIDPVSKPNIIPENKEHRINRDQKSASEEIASKNLNPKEKSKNKQEVVIHERRRHWRDGRVYYISGATILLIILIVIILAG
jgi:hypothetical protein